MRVGFMVPRHGENVANRRELMKNEEDQRVI